MRSTIRRVREAVENNDLETAKNEFKVAQKKLDRAAANNLIHKNAAARTKSRLNNLIKNAAQTA